MNDTPGIPTVLVDGWQRYQEQLSAALAPLTDEQLALRAADGLRSIEEIATHLIACRARWFHLALGEGDEEFAAIGEWDRSEEPTRPASDLVAGMATTWRLMQATLARYTPATLQETVEDEDDGQVVILTRGWVIWHVLEHDLHHGGEISFSLGMHGLTAPDI